MFRVVLLVAIGILIGYFIGFSDAQENDKNIVSRTIERVGGSARDNVGNDIDKRYKEVGR
jgi:hypothetical protein